MAGTFTQIYIQIVFAVKGRENLIQKTWAETLHKYIAGIIKGKEQKAIIINGAADHIHAFVGLKPSMATSDLARDIKNNSSKFINAQRVDKGQVLLARRIRSFLLLTLTYKSGLQLYSKPGRSS